MRVGRAGRGGRAGVEGGSSTFHHEPDADVILATRNLRKAADRQKAILPNDFVDHLISERYLCLYARRVDDLVLLHHLAALVNVVEVLLIILRKIFVRGPQVSSLAVADDHIDLLRGIYLQEVALPHR